MVLCCKCYLPKALYRIFHDNIRTHTEITRWLQRLLYWCEHLKYIWNVYCVVTNHRRDTESTESECFPISHGFHDFCAWTNRRNKLLSICFKMHPWPFLAEILQGNNFLFFLFGNSMYSISEGTVWAILDEPTSSGRCGGLAARIVKFQNMQIRSKRTMYSLAWYPLGFFGFSIEIRSQLTSHYVQLPKYQMTIHKRFHEKTYEWHFGRNNKRMTHLLCAPTIWISSAVNLFQLKG